MTVEFPRTEISSCLSSVAFRTYTSNFDVKVKKIQNCYYVIKAMMPVTLTGIIIEVWNRHHSHEKWKINWYENLEKLVVVVIYSRN
jgi:hypothetical protein